MELLPVDLLADILHRLSAHDLAAARCVHSSWRAVIHSHRLMQLVPLPLAGIFLSFNDHAFSELLARPTPPSAKVSGKLHQYMPTADPVPVADHCNGLLLLSCAYVANPATRRWATLPFPPPSFPASWNGFPLPCRRTTRSSRSLTFLIRARRWPTPRSMGGSGRPRP
jgi:hypothetical protein